jgi:hypothetical protein
VRRVNAPFHARTLLIGAILCTPAAAFAHGQGGHAALGPAGVRPMRPFTLRTGVSLPLGPRARANEGAPRNAEPGNHLIEGVSGPRTIETSPPVPTPASDFDPLRRRRVALPAPPAET